MDDMQPISSAKAIIVGAGAHGRVILDILRHQGKYRTIEFIDDNPALWGTKVNDAPVVGGTDFLISGDGLEFPVVIAIGNNPVRLSIARKLEKANVKFMNVIHPSAVVMPTAQIGKGNMLCANSVVNSNAILHDHVIVNTGAIVEHDCILEDGVCVCPGVSMAGRIVIKEGSFIGTGATLIGTVVIGAGSIVGAASLVLKDVPPNVLVYGSPAKVIQEIDATFDWSRTLL